MSENTSQKAGVSKEAAPSDPSKEMHAGSGQTQRSDQAVKEAGLDDKEDAHPAPGPKQLKSHFRGMPKDWAINRSRCILM